MQPPDEYPSSQPPQQPYSQPYQHMPRPDGPPPGYPPYPQPPQRPQTKLSPFWRAVVIACGVLILACAACGVIGSMTKSSTNTTTTTQSAPTQQPTVASTPTVKTATQSAQKTGNTTFAATHGKPHVGGLFSDFIGKYGQPGATTKQLYNFYTGDNQSITVSAQVSGEKVTQVLVNGQDTWSKADTTTYCAQFNPDDATQATKTDGPAGTTILYDSASVGRFTLMVFDGGACTLNLAG